MATLLELDGLAYDATMLGRIRSALRDKAQDFKAAWVTNPASVSDAEMAWARVTLLDPAPDAKRAMAILLAENSGLTVAQVQAVSDATITTAVGAVIGFLVAARAVS